MTEYNVSYGVGDGERAFVKEIDHVNNAVRTTRKVVKLFLIWFRCAQICYVSTFLTVRSNKKIRMFLFDLNYC